MITAQEAKELAQQSEASLNKFIDLLGLEIRKLAEDGKYEYIYTGGKTGDPTPTADIHLLEYQVFRMPKFWELVTQKLKTHPLSFRVDTYKSAPEVPRGLGVYDDNEPPRVTYGLRIRW
jgi:hypothetical protein